MARGGLLRDALRSLASTPFLPPGARSCAARECPALRQDLNRFTFLPGSSDGESLFGPEPG